MAHEALVSTFLEVQYLRLGSLQTGRESKIQVPVTDLRGDPENNRGGEDKVGVLVSFFIPVTNTPDKNKGKVYLGLKVSEGIEDPLHWSGHR